METNSPNETGKKLSLEDLPKEELIKRCKSLLVIAQKAKHAKDALQEENAELKNRLSGENATSEIIENLTQQKLSHVTTIEDLKRQNSVLNNKLQQCYEENNVLDSENVSFKRQIKRLTDENEQLITHLESLEKQTEECKKLGLEQQNQLLVLEEANQKLQNENSKEQGSELQKMLSVSLEEVKKLQSENNALKEKIEDFKVHLAEKDKNILIISDELQQKSGLTDDLTTEIGNLKTQIQELRLSVEEKNSKIEELQTDQSAKDLEETNGKLRERLKSYHGKIVKLAGNIKVLKENKNEILALFKSYTNQVEEWKSQLTAASQTLVHHVNVITLQNAEFQSENQTLKENNAKFMEQLEMHKTDDEKSKELDETENVKVENQRLSEEIENLLAIQEEHRNKIEALTLENEAINSRSMELAQKHQQELKVFDDQSKKDTIEIRNRIEENEKICIEYRKIITKLEDDLEVNSRQVEDLKQKNFALRDEVERLKQSEKEFADRTSEEIFKLVQENAKLMETNRRREDVRENQSQTEDTGPGDLEDRVTSSKRENSELLSEMNEMNQALKERGETISKLQAHCEEVMKKLQIYESQANRNVDCISEKEEIIKQLRQEIELRNKESGDEVDNSGSRKDREIDELKNEIESLRERLNSALETSYAESESMSTSTISRTDEVNRLKDLEGSWEERYGKLRTLAVKLKGKVRELSAELVKEQNEKNDIQQKLGGSIKTISTLQAQCDRLEDELEASKKENKENFAKLDSVAVEISKDKQKLVENEETICSLKKEIEELKQEKINTEAWKKQISGKVQTFRKELEVNKVVKKELEAKITKLTAELEAKEQALKAESDCHKHTKNSLEHSNNERMKNSVLSLEMQDYERSVKELSQKLEKKQEQINKLKSQIESQKSTANAVREQNKLLEEQAEEMRSDVTAAQAEVVALKKQISELEEAMASKDNKIQDTTQLLETIRSENEELSTELSKVIAEHQKHNANLKMEKDHLRSQNLGLQQTLRETQDTLRLKEDELRLVQNDYDNYKVRAQSVLRQNQNRDVGLEEKLSEELSGLREKSELLASELKDCKKTIESLKKENEDLGQEKRDLQEKYEETRNEVEDLKALYDQLTNKHQQTITEHSETVRSLKVHAETLAQCYRQQLSEQEVRHNREIIELQSKIEKAPSPTELPFPPLPTMHREEGEGSESTETSKIMHPVPLERLLGTDSDQEVAFIKKQLGEEESKVIHLTALLADTEQDLAKHVQMNKLLKEEIRRQQRSVEREKHAENLEYLKNVVFKFVTLNSGDERSRLVPVLNTILKLSPEETQKLSMVARGDPGIRGWTNYLPSWSPKSS